MKISDLSHRKIGNSRQNSSWKFKDCPSVGMMSRKKVGEDAYREIELACEDTMVDLASTSGLSGNLGMLDNCGSCNICSTLNFATGSPNDKNLHVQAQVVGEINVAENDLSLQPNTTDMGFSYSHRRNISSLRSKRTVEHHTKPLNSLVSCLLAQLYKERAEMEEYIFRSAPSSTRIVRPFVVTDGGQIISRTDGDSYSTPSRDGLKKLQKNVFSQESGAVLGVPQLPNIGSLRKAEANKGKDHCGSFSRKENKSSHGAFLVCLGIFVGVFSSFLAHKKEVDKLNGFLKQTENLVQDLQEELEMRDSLTVKELAADDYESQDTHSSSYNDKELLHVFSPEKKLSSSSKQRSEEHHCEHSEGESISKIEAELEAELERLELNMNSFQFEEESSEVVELDPDPDFLPNLAEGDLQTDIFNRKTNHQPYADQDGSGNSTPHYANYSVSPRELSLRLHQAIQAQLEERVRELEMALEHSQRKVCDMEAKLNNQWRSFSNSEAESSRTQGSPVAKDSPIVIYNDACEEFSEINKSGEDLGLRIGKINGQDNVCGRDHNVDWIQNSMPSDDGDDEVEKMLIKHIVEKARKGSPHQF